MNIQEQIQRKKILNIDKAIDRIKWRFGQGKAFKANFTDVQALNSIITWVNRQKTAELKEYPLFAKMYIMLYGLFLKHYNTDPFDPQPERELHRLLDRDMSIIIHEFWEELNFDSLSKRLNVLSSFDISKHPAFTTDQERKEFLDNFEALPIEEKKAFWQKEYNQETVTDILNNIVNEAINRFGNEKD